MNSTELSLGQKIDKFKIEVMKKYGRELTNFFRGDEKEMKKYMSAVVYSVNKTPSLLDNIPSLTTAVIELAQTGLAPGPTQEAYILPYKGKATAMIGYQGWVRLLNQSGITKIVAEIVYENDTFEYQLGSDGTIIHKVNPRLCKAERGEPIGCYVIIGENSKYMNSKDILHYRDEFSQGYKDKEKRKYSPWLVINDPELNMRKKTVLKQLVKYIKENGVKTSLGELEKIGKAIEIDNNEAPVNGQAEIITGPTTPSKSFLGYVFGDPDEEREEEEKARGHKIKNEEENYKAKNGKKIKELEDEVQEGETEIITGGEN